MTRNIFHFLAAALTGAGCVGVVGDGGSPSTDTDVVDHGDPGHLVVHRLNNTEYNNTVRDLLGTALRPADDFPTDDYSFGFDNISSALSMSPIQVELYVRAARELAAEAVVALEEGTADNPALDRILVCVPQATDEGCVRDIVVELGERAWRRPLQPAEVDDAVELFDFAIAGGASLHEALAVVFEDVLSSPHFLFRFELDPDPESLVPRPLTDHELASRLSYFLWSSMPDDALLQAAADGVLHEPEELRRQVERMLDDPKAAALTEGFASQWLYLRGLDGHAVDETLFPEFTAPLSESMAEETRRFFGEFLASDRPVTEMLTADFTYVDARLAAHYGLGLEGQGFARVSLDGTERAGLLGQASLLTVTSHPDRTSPVKRGQWVLEQLLCSEPPPPPPGVEGLIEEGPATGSIRDQLEQHRTDPACAACHVAMDPIGLALEHFDALGAWRETDGEYSIDATGELPDGSSFDGAIELGQVLSTDPRFTECLTEKMLTYALGRGVEDDDQTIERVHEALLAEGSTLPSLITLVATSYPFLYRRGEPAQ